MATYTAGHYESPVKFSVLLKAIYEQAPQMLAAGDEDHDPIPDAKIVVEGVTYTVVDEESSDDYLRLAITTEDKSRTLAFISMD